jgi:hypothetical protein
MGEMDERCEPDSGGRQMCLRPSLYPSDVLNILTETGGLRLRSSTSQGNALLVWILVK